MSMGEAMDRTLKGSNAENQAGASAEVTVKNEAEAFSEEEEKQEDGVTFRLMLEPPQASSKNGEEVQVVRPICIDQLSPQDTVMALKQLISELPELACYTCYHLEVTAAPLEDGSHQAEWLPLSDYMELGEYPHIQSNDTVVRMVLDQYNTREAKIHIRRLREVLANPPMPMVTSESMQDDNTATDAQIQEKIPSKTSTVGDEDEEAVKKQIDLLRKIHEKIEVVEFPLECKLSNFYGKDTTRRESKSLGDLPKCLKSITFSGFNPPPGPRKLAGDLFYLEAKMMDDSVQHITASASGFFVNCTTEQNFNPSPHKSYAKSHLLMDVLKASSTLFVEKLQELQDAMTVLAKHGPVSMETIFASGNMASGKPQWNIPFVPQSNSSAHSYDMNRAEDELCDSYGMDSDSHQRDWNEEYQCCKELPHESTNDAIIRLRGMHKIASEFVDAATRGAVAVAEGSIPPMNPMDDERTHVWVFNNMFFSKAHYNSQGGSVADKIEEATYCTSNHDLNGVLAYNSADVDGLHTILTAIVDYLGTRIVVQSIIPGILQGDAASRLVYGSVDNGKSVASNEHMHRLMCKAGAKLHLAEREVCPLGMQEASSCEEMSTADVLSEANGEAVTTPVTICGPVEAKGLRGADGRHYVIDMIRGVTPRDTTFYDHNNSNKVQKVEEGEKMQVSENNMGLCFQRSDDGYVAVLRGELLTSYVRNKQKSQSDKSEMKKQDVNGGEELAAQEKKLESKKIEEEEQTKPANAVEEEANKEEQDAVVLNLNVFEKYVALTDAELLTKDKEVVEEASSFLQQFIIPGFLTEIRNGNASPMDGESLSFNLHAWGINMRYLGRLAALTCQLESMHAMPKYFLEILETEMIARVVKRVLSKELSSQTKLRSAPGQFFADFFNGLLGTKSKGGCSTDRLENQHAIHSTSTKSSKKKKKKNNGKDDKEIESQDAVQNDDRAMGTEDESTLPGSSSSSSSGSSSSSSAGCWTCDSVWERILMDVKQKFGYDLSLWKSRDVPDEEVAVMEKKNAPRRLFTIRTHKLPLLRRVCQLTGVQVSSRDYNFGLSQPFNVNDIHGVKPVVKSCLPLHPSKESMDLLAAGQMHMVTGNMAMAYNSLQASLQLMYQICGSETRDAIQCCSLMASVLFQSGDVPAALYQQQKVLAMSIQLNGLDHQDTALAHSGLALLLHAHGETDEGLKHMHRAIYLLEIIGGPHLPEILSCYFKLALMYQEVGVISLALSSYREALCRVEYDRLQIANILHHMAMTCSMAQLFREALRYERQAYGFYKRLLGEKDRRTMESAALMETFTEKAVEGARGQKKHEAASAAESIAKQLEDMESLHISGDLKKSPKGKGKKKKP